MNLGQMDWAWLAGLFEGEGTINFTSKRSVAVRIVMTDRDVLETVDRLCPSPNGLLTRLRDNPRHNTTYVWELSARDDVVAFIEGIRPWLHARRGQRADEALVRLQQNRGWHSGKVQCRNGHVWAEAGIYVSPSGKRHCRACVKESHARYRERHRERYLKIQRESQRRYRAKEKIS